MKRFIFAVVWSIVFYFGACILVGAGIGFQIGIRTPDPHVAAQKARRAAAETVTEWRPYLLGGALLLATAGAALGILPGTRRAREADSWTREAGQAMKCPHCQALNVEGEQTCAACGAPLRRAQSGVGKWAAFYVAVCLGGITAGMLFLRGHDTGAGRILSADERDQRIGQVIGKACAWATVISFLTWLRSRRQ